MSDFLDEVAISVFAGRGGRGAVSFRHEKYVPLGGPDGGDGGCGGSIILVADSDDTTLGAFRQRRRFAAGNGGDGAGSQKTGRDAGDLKLSVPLGTVVRDADSQEVLADLDLRGARIVVAQGGRGGRGNVHFASAVHQAPRIGELGAKGEARHLELELKLIADIGLVGLPNAGKSTLLAALTGAHPKVAAYPFTTLHPNLGVAEFEDGRTVVLADVPGLIEGAHHGAGLGIDFLRHLERTRVLIHIVDASAGPDEVRRALRDVGAELRAFSATLAAKPTLVAFNKLDIPDAVTTVTELRDEWPDAHAISAVTVEACRELLLAAAAEVFRVCAAEKEAQPEAPADGGERHHVYRYSPRRREAPVISRDGEAFRVSHVGIEKIVDITDLDSEEAVTRLQNLMQRVGVDAALAAVGCVEGDTVRIGEAEFIYSDDGVHG